MKITGTKAWQSYTALCKMLDKNDISYEKDDENLCAKCTVSGKDTDMNFLFTVDASKMLITLYSLLPIQVDEDKAADVALALCVVNNSLSDGAFSLDTANLLVYYKMTSSFYNSKSNPSVYEYMLSVAADVIDDYFIRLKNLITSGEPYTISDNTPQSALVQYINGHTLTDHKS